ncbi:MAG: protease SohB [SAR86 cluster bacterium]
MLDLLVAYGFFLLKIITVLLVILIPILMISSSTKHRKETDKGRIIVKNLSDKLEEIGVTLKSAEMDPKAYKSFLKERNKKKKKEIKGKSKEIVYVLDFKGDIQASAVGKLKQEINAIIASQVKCKEVVIKVESGGGSAYAYGLCAAELKRLVDNKIKLTVCIDKIAASGGYLMSCVATKIVAAPWAIVGSIGVIAQLPNFHRLLKKLDIDIEMHTAGKFKRTLTTLGENTKQGREKFISELEDLHVVFKDFVKENRSKIQVAKVATGEVWQGDKAKKLGLIDEIGTSDDYLLKLASKFKLLEIQYFEKKPFTARIGSAAEVIVEKGVYKILDIFNKDRFIT